MTRPRLDHRRAIALMAGTAALWSMAGVITRQLERAASFEVTFWRSLFAALVVGLVLLVERGGLWRPLRAAGWPGLVSGVMWSVMFTCFMVALTLTTVANTLIVMSVAPILTAVLARLFLAEPIAPRTWLAIGLASLGLAWMFGDGLAGGQFTGMAVAAAVPLAASINFILNRHHGDRVDLIPAVMVGGVLSALYTLPFAWPAVRAGLISGHDLALLAVLGVFQLGLPCVLMVKAARHLAAPEIALLALIEVLLGPIWAWLGAGEVPAASTLQGGAVVLVALVWNSQATRRDKAARASVLRQ